MGSTRFLLLLGWMAVLLLSSAALAGASRAQPPESLAPVRSATARAFHLPFVRTARWQSPFGVEYVSSTPLTSGITLSEMDALGTSWVRMNTRVSWRTLQPVEGGPIQWERVAAFEEELRALQRIGATPLPIIYDSPTWATINVPFPTACGAVRTDKLDDLAQFVRALVARYKAPEFNVHHWELWNEPDIDPALVRPDMFFGCWGDAQDPFYGGRHYGEMLKVVGPAIKAEDPTAKVWLGGLLLYTFDTHWTNDPGKPEMFLKGVLESGAAPYFDVLAYHAYAPYYTDEVIDHEVVGIWETLGGFIVGKARYLRAMMAEYGVDKPLFVNEVALMCSESVSLCTPPSSLFFEAQANHAVRALVRGLSEGIMGYTWFTVDGPAWRYTSLLNRTERKPVFYAYQTLNDQLRYTTYSHPLDYDERVEAYAFNRRGEQVQVIWARANESVTLTLPAAGFLRAVDRVGVPISHVPVGSSSLQVTVGFSPIYVIRQAEAATTP